MSRRVAFRQCDVTRALRAAKEAGASRVVVQPDGSLAIELETPREGSQGPVRADVGGKDVEIVL